MLKKFLFFLTLATLLHSCSSEDDTMSSLDESIHSTIEGAYEADNRWIYEQMNHHYLWREDLPDSLSCDYTSDPVTFYYSLLSAKDRFSYCERNTSYTGPIDQSHYGFEYQMYENHRGEKLLQVLYITSEFLKKQTLHRGDWLRELNTSSQRSDIKLYERGEIKGNTFIPFDTLTVELNIWGNPQSTVYMDTIYSINNKKIGYLCYLEYDNTRDLEKSIKKFYQENIDELILDLRYNPGGYVSTCRYLCNSIVPANAYEMLFQQRRYNDILTEELKEETGEEMSKEYYSTPSRPENTLGTKLYGLDLSRLYVLTSQYTASASEANIVCLRPYMDVFIIGEQTYGKGVGSYTIRDSRYKYQLQPITSQYYNAKMETTPNEGIKPDIEVPGGYDTALKELGDINEPLLATALNLILEKDIQPIPFTRSTNPMWKAISTPSFFKLLPEY